MTDNGNNGLEIENSNAVRDLIGYEYKRYDREHSYNIKGEVSLIDSPEDDDISEEQADVEHGVLALIAGEDDELVRFIVVHDGIQAGDDTGVGDKEEACI